MTERSYRRTGIDAPKRYLTDEETIADATGEGFGIGQTEHLYREAICLYITPTQESTTVIAHTPRVIPYELRDNS